MDVLIDRIINQFETGKLTRRKMIESLAVAAMTVYGAGKLEGSKFSQPLRASRPRDGADEPASPGCDTDQPRLLHLRGLPQSARFLCRSDGHAGSGRYAKCAESPVRPGQSTVRTASIWHDFQGCNALQRPRGNSDELHHRALPQPNPAAPPASPAAGTGQRANQPAQPESQVTIDHMAYTIADWDAARVERF